MHRGGAGSGTEGLRGREGMTGLGSQWSFKFQDEGKKKKKRSGPWQLVPKKKAHATFEEPAPPLQWVLNWLKEEQNTSKGR